MILGRFKNKRKLGAGGFGIVYLVEDQKGQQFALKLIPLDEIRKEPILKQYLQGEIDCMKSTDSPFLIKLYQTFEDKNFIYLLLQYCQGGDLQSYQYNFMDRVFPLQKATQILADVLKGLQYLHGQSYLHRDIKPQNILIKKIGGKDTFKLADFGFSKPVSDTTGTNLGTDQYKAPQIFFQKKYGYEVDMWAFGVLLYKMINRDNPFKLPFIASQQKKGVFLSKLAQNFSYKSSVNRSKLNKSEYCTPQMQKLFSSIFQVDQKKRLSFIQLRESELFKKHFPNLQQKSKIIYSKRIELVSMTSSVSKPVPKQHQEKQEQNAPVHMSRIHSKTDYLKEQKQLLGSKKEQIDFLSETIFMLQSSNSLFEHHEILMVNYNLLKYYIILLRRFRDRLTIDKLNEKYGGDMKWKEYTQTKQFGEMRKEVVEDIAHNQIKFFGVYDECQNYLPPIKEINKHFQSAFLPVVNQLEFDGQFKSSYRASTGYMYASLLKQMKKGKKGNKLYYLLTLLVLCHAFNNLFHDREHMLTIFEPYLSDKKITPQKIDYSDLKTWLSSSSPDVLIKIARSVIKLYLQ